MKRHLLCVVIYCGSVRTKGKPNEQKRSQAKEDREKERLRRL